MRLYLDTANTQDWVKLLPLGVFYGITTNPLLAQRAGLDYARSDWRGLLAHAKALATARCLLATTTATVAQPRTTPRATGQRAWQRLRTSQARGSLVASGPLWLRPSSRYLWVCTSWPSVVRLSERPRSSQELACVPSAAVEARGKPSAQQYARAACSHWHRVVLLWQGP